MSTTTTPQLLALPLDQLDAETPLQQRRIRAAAEQEEGLAQSIRALGLLQPILVRRSADGERWEVIDGHRRVAAARAIGLETVPAMPFGTDQREAFAAGVAANVARAGMAPVDQWRAIVRLQELGWTVAGAALALGIGERLARRLDKLGRLHPDMLAAIEAHGMPEEAELAAIAGAPHPIQAAALAGEHAWFVPRKGKREPQWDVIADACEIERIPAKRAIFDVAASGLLFEEDLFAEPGSDEQLTTTDVAHFLAAQRKALDVKAERSKKLHAVDWSKAQHGPALPPGWTRCWDAKTVGAERFAAVAPSGYDVGKIVEIYALPPAKLVKPTPGKTTGGTPAESTESANRSTASANRSTASADPTTGAAEDDGGAEEDGNDDDAAPAASRTALAPKPARGPVTEAGRILIAEAKTTAIRCALRDRRDLTAEQLLAVLVLALCGRNVRVFGDPQDQFSAADFADLAWHLVDAEGQPRTPEPGAVLRLAAEAAARMIVCAPAKHYANVSGDAAEWIGAAIGAERFMPRLDTPAILATVSGDALKSAALAAGETAVKGTTKALRERLANSTPNLRLPGCDFTAPGPRPKQAEDEGEEASEE